MAVKRYTGSPPPALRSAIASASATYGVPADVLTGIWRVESASTYPNPAVNSSGYGGLFGTSFSSAAAAGAASAQEQANTAASILASLLVRNKGDLGRSLSSYSGGGYTTVPGQTSFALTAAQLSTAVQATFHGATARVGQPSGPLAGVGRVALGATAPITKPVDAAITAGKDVVSAGSFLGKLSDPSYILRGLQIVAGAVLVLVGTYLLARQVGLAVSEQTPQPVKDLAAKAPVVAAVRESRAQSRSFSEGRTQGRRAGARREGAKAGRAEVASREPIETGITPVYSTRAKPRPQPAEPPLEDIIGY